VCALELFLCVQGVWGIICDGADIYVAYDRVSSHQGCVGSMGVLVPGNGVWPWMLQCGGSGGTMGRLT
jgi:hypothetical protein